MSSSGYGVMIGAGCIATALLLSSPAAAQLRIDVGPSSAAPQGYTEQGWAIIPAQGLYDQGPSYDQRSGARVGRGSQLPDWIETAPVENVSVDRLPPGVHEYFISPDRKIVFVGTDRRVLRVLRP